LFSNLHKADKQLYTIGDLLEWKPPELTRIIHSGILNTKSRMLVFGDEGSWKSILALHTAHSIARGSNWLGFTTTKSNIFRLQVEMPMYMDRVRVQKYCIGSFNIYKAKNNGLADVATLANAYAYPPNVASRTEQFIHIDESFGFESLKKNVITCITEMPEAPLVIILDPLYKMFNRDLGKELDVRPMLDRLDLLIEETGASVIIVHHSRKAQVDSEGTSVDMGSQDATGSRAIARWVDTILRIDLLPDDETQSKVLMRFTKHRNAEEPLPILTIKWNRGTLHPQVTSRRIPIDITAEGEIEARGDSNYMVLE
jgi:KaiC/GvpD/RAD55 family RecA-like ATPase